MNRYAILPLRKDLIANAKIGEIIIDLDNGHVSTKNEEGEISATIRNEETIANFISDLISPTGSQNVGVDLGGFTSANLDDLLDELKLYIDNTKQRLVVKDSVRVASDLNITLSGLGTVDGVTLLENDRVLLAGQTNSVENGIYLAKTDAWVRATDADEQVELENGTFVFVEEGTNYGNSGWVLSTDNDPIPGTDPLEFVRFSGAGQIVAGVGISKNGNILSLTPTGVTAGTYTKVIVDEHGRVMSAENPTTLSGYGIVDAAPKSHVGSSSTDAHPIASDVNHGFMSKDMFSNYTKLVDDLLDGNESTMFNTDSNAGFIGLSKLGGDITTDIKINSLKATIINGNTVYQLADNLKDDSGWNLTNATMERDGWINVLESGTGTNVLELLGLPTRVGEQYTFIVDVVNNISVDADIKLKDVQFSAITNVGTSLGNSKETIVFTTPEVIDNTPIRLFVVPTGTQEIDIDIRVKAVLLGNVNVSDELKAIPHCLDIGLNHTEDMVLEVTANNNLINPDWTDTSLPTFTNTGKLLANESVEVQLNSNIIPDEFMGKVTIEPTPFNSVVIDDINSKLLIQNGSSDTTYNKNVSLLAYTNVDDSVHKNYKSDVIPLPILRKWDAYNITAGEVNSYSDVLVLDALDFTITEDVTNNLKVLTINNIGGAGKVVSKVMPTASNDLGEFLTISEFAAVASEYHYGFIDDDLLIAFDINKPDIDITNMLDGTECLINTSVQSKTNTRPYNIEIGSGSAYKFYTRVSEVFTTGDVTTQKVVSGTDKIKNIKEMYKIVLGNEEKLKVKDFSITASGQYISGFEPQTTYRAVFEKDTGSIVPVFSYIVPLNTLNLIKSNYIAISLLEDKLRDVDLVDNVTNKTIRAIQNSISDSVTSQSSTNIASSKAVQTVNAKVEDATFILNKLLTVDGPTSGINAQYVADKNINDLFKKLDIPGNDFNNALELGVYHTDAIETVANAPQGLEGNAVITVMHNYGEDAHQMAVDATGRIAVRFVRNGIGYNEWARLYTSDQAAKFNSVNVGENGEGYIGYDNNSNSIIIKP